MVGPCGQKIEDNTSMPSWHPQITVLAKMQKASYRKLLFSHTYTCQAVPGVFGPVSLFPHRTDIGKLVQVQQRAGGIQGYKYGIWTGLRELGLLSLEKRG